MALTQRGRLVQLAWLLESEEPGAVSRRVALPLEEWRRLLVEYRRLRDGEVAAPLNGCRHHSGPDEDTVSSEVMALDDDWITTAAAAELAGLHPERVRELARDRRIVAEKFARTWLISRQSVLDYVEEQRKAGKKRGPRTPEKRPSKRR